MDITHAMLRLEMIAELQLYNVARNNNPDAEIKTSTKLIATCSNKYNYVVHFRTLQFYLRHGLKIIRIHNVVKFKQEPIYKDYIDFTTARRSLAKNEFDKSYYKQKNCSLFGRSIQDVRNRLKVKLVGDALNYVYYASKPTILGSVILAPDWPL